VRHGRDRVPVPPDSTKAFICAALSRCPDEPARAGG
jgi:hypothetical protein